MKTKKIITIIMIFVFIVCLLIWTIPSLTMGQDVSPNSTPDEAVAKLIKEGVAYNQALGMNEPRILPGNIFYFIKNFIWGLRYQFVSEPIKQLTWDLRVVSEKLLELQKLAAIKPEKSNSLNKSLANYKVAMSRFQTHLGNLSVGSQVVNVSAFLNQLTEASLEYEKIFSDVLSRKIPEALKDQVNELVGQGVELLIAAAQKLAAKEDIFNDFSDKIQKNYSGLLSHFRSLETVLATEKILGSLSESGVSNLEEKLYLQVESELKNFSQLTKNKIAEVITFLPGNKLIQGKIIRELEERSGQTEFFQEIGDKLKQLPVSSRDLKKCQEEVGVLGAELSSFKAKINLTELSENIKSLLEQAEGHLKRAEEIMNDGTQTGTFCGLVNSSGVLLRNVQRTLEKSQPAEIEGQVKSAEEKLAALTEQTKSLNQDEYSRIFDLLNRAVVGLESIKVNWQNNDVSQALRQLNSFDVIIKNIEKTLELVNNKLNKAEAKAMGLQKEFLKKSKLEEFYQWCQKQAGTILDDLSVLPYCLDANKNSLSMFDWLNKTQ